MTSRPILVQLVDARHDRLYQGVSFAVTAAASGRDVVVAFFLGALDALVSGRLEEPRFDGLEPALAERLAEGFERHPASIAQLLRDGREFGVRVYACSGSVELLGLEVRDVLEHVDDVVGLVTILRKAGDDASILVF